MRVFVLTGFEEEGTSSGGLEPSSKQKEGEMEEDEGCSSCEELKAQLKSLAEKNNQLEGRLQVERDLHRKDMDDLQARHSKIKDEKAKLVEEITRLNQKAREIFQPPLPVLQQLLQNHLFFAVLQPFKVCLIKCKGIQKSNRPFEAVNNRCFSCSRSYFTLGQQLQHVAQVIN